jgi:hypothetical protein
MQYILSLFFILLDETGKRKTYDHTSRISRSSESSRTKVKNGLLIWNFFGSAELLIHTFQKKK